MSNDTLVKISVIMMTYNHEKYISKAIEGVLMQQTTFPVELIVANDHSTDRTEEMVQHYRNKNAAIVKGYYNKKNLGPRYNFIKAFSMANSKYIAMCEGDDYWTDPFKLQKQVDFLEKNENYSFCSHSFDMVDKNNIFLTSPNSDLEEKYREGFEINMEIYFERWITQTLTNVFRRCDVNLDIFSYKILSDTVLYFDLLKGKNGYWLNMKSGCYRIHESSSWNGLTLKKRLILSYKIFLQLLKKNSNIMPLRKALINKTRQILDQILDENNKSDFNLIKLLRYCISYYKVSIDKTTAKKYLHDRVFKKIFLRYKINIRRLINRKYKLSTDLYRHQLKK